MVAQCVTNWRGKKKGVLVALRRGTLWGDWGTHLSSLLISCEIRVVVLEKCVQSIFLLRAIHFHCNRRRRKKCRFI